MPTNKITIEMLLAEQKRLLAVMQSSYPKQVAEGKITPYTRDHRYNCLETIIQLLQKILANRPTTETTQLSKQLNQLQ